MAEEEATTAPVATSRWFLKWMKRRAVAVKRSSLALRAAGLVLLQLLRPERLREQQPLCLCSICGA